MKPKGHTTTEYGICIALLGILAFSSLKLLGGNISILLQAPMSGPASMQANQLFSLIGANIGMSGPITTNGGTTNVSSLNIQLTVDPTTGQIITTDSTGGGTNTTSVPGDQAMMMLAQQMGQLANMKLPNGQPLPSDIQAQILKLTQDGQALGTSYSAISGMSAQFNAINAANAGKSSGLEQYPSTLTSALGSNLGQSVQFQQDYAKLSTMLSSLSPSLSSSIAQQVNQLAGGISSIQYNNVGKNFANNINVNAISTTDLMSIYTQNPPLQAAVPLSTMMGTMMLPPGQMAPAMEQIISTAAAGAVVGDPPTASNPITLTVNPPSGSGSGS